MYNRHTHTCYFWIIAIIINIYDFDFTLVFFLTIITWPWCIGARRGSLTPELLKISFISSVRWWTNLQECSVMLRKIWVKKGSMKKISIIPSVRWLTNLQQYSVMSRRKWVKRGSIKKISIISSIRWWTNLQQCSVMSFTLSLPF